MKKIYQNTSVYEASKKRLEYIFLEFDNIYISFSGGKDSSVLLNLVLDYLKANPNAKNKLSIYHMDYEAGYQQSIDFVEKTLKELKDKFNIYHICMPVKAQCAVSMSHTYWRPWELETEDIWVRKLPEDSINIKNYKEKGMDFYDEKLSDYEFNIEFAKWLHKKNNAKKTIALIGLRADESLNRFRAIVKEKESYKDQKYTTKVDENIYNAYPIYDFSVEDIWIANAKFGYSYNELYDLFYYAGLSINQMRVASPFNDCAISSLKLYKSINPDMWGKMVNRVNGVNFASIYGDTTAMAWRGIKLPKGHTWKSYCDFLLNTLECELREHYKAKFQTSVKFWKEKGGALSEQTIKELRKEKIPFKKQGKISKISKKEVVTFNKYPDSADVYEAAKVPSYKRMCITILKNDFTCKYMGFGATKSENEKRKIALEKYKDL